MFKKATHKKPWSSVPSMWRRTEWDCIHRLRGLWCSWWGRSAAGCSRIWRSFPSTPSLGLVLVPRTAWGWWHYGAAPVTSNVQMYSMGLVVLWRSTCHKHRAFGIMAQHLSQATSRCTAWGWWYYGAAPVTSIGLLALWRSTCHKQRPDVQHGAGGIMAQHLSQA